MRSRKVTDLQYRGNCLRLCCVHVTVHGWVTLETDGLMRLKHVVILEMVAQVHRILQPPFQLLLPCYSWDSTILLQQFKTAFACDPSLSKANPQSLYATTVEGSLSTSENDCGLHRSQWVVRTQFKSQSIAAEQSGPGSPFTFQEVAFLPLEHKDSTHHTRWA